MDAKTYEKMTNRMVVGRKVISTQALRNGYAELPAGTVFTVQRKLNGYHVESDPCRTCGVKIRMSNVPWHAVELFDDHTEDETVLV